MDFKALRAAKNKKAQSMIESSGGKVDSSTWTPDEKLNADAKTGMRPISRRAFKAGGKVEGEKAKTNLSRSPRGFEQKVGLANTNQKDANEEREGKKHVGGMKKGGMVKKAGGGELAPKTSPRPMKRPDDAVMAPKTSPRPMPRPQKNPMTGELETPEETQTRLDSYSDYYKDGGRTKMADGGMDFGQKYRKANARNLDLEQLGKAKLNTADKVDMYPRTAMAEMNKQSSTAAMNSGTPFEQKAIGSRMLGDAYLRSRGADVPQYKKGGKAEKFEGSAKDMMEDKKMAAKRGMTMKEWEASNADKKHDMPSAKASGGKLKMVEKDGKKVPDFAADGVGKMNTGGRTAKMGGGSMGMGMSSPMMPAMNPMASGYKAGGKAMHHKDCMCKACGGSAGYSRGGSSNDSNKEKFDKFIASLPKQHRDKISNEAQDNAKDATRMNEGDDVFWRHAHATARDNYEDYKDKGEMQKGGSAGMKSGGGLYANINAKRKSGEKMRDAGDKGAPSAQDFKDAAKTAKKQDGGRMARATGGRAKGTTNISINVMPHTANKPMGIESPLPPMPMPPMGGPPPMMPPPSPPRMSLPSGLGAAMAGASGVGPMPPPSGAPMPPPMMGRKAGGKVYPKMQYGSGGGKGRLEKIDEYGKNA